MSLINEALKRARDASSQVPPPAHGSPAYQPVMTPPMMTTPSTMRPVVWLVLIIVVVVAAVPMMWNRNLSKPIAVADNAATPAAAAPPTPGFVALTPPDPAPSAAAATVTEPVHITDRIESDPMPVVEPLPAPDMSSAPVMATQPLISPPPPPASPLPPPPAMTLQAVMVHGASRQAIVNGRAVVVGDMVDGAEVVRIEQRTVVFRWHGSDVTLRMP